MPPDSPILHENLPLIQVREPRILDQLLADRIASAYLAVRLSERVAVVVPGRMDALFERLRHLGHLPRVRGVQ